MLALEGDPNGYNQLPLTKEEKTSYQLLKQYLIENAHSVLAARSYKKVGEFFFYDAVSIESESQDEFTTSFFRSGPKHDDFYFWLREIDGKLYVKVMKSGLADLDDIFSKIVEVISHAGGVSAKRMDSSEGPKNSPYGYGLTGMTPKNGVVGETCRKNYYETVRLGLFTLDFVKYCLDRNFQLAYRDPNKKKSKKAKKKPLAH